MLTIKGKQKFLRNVGFGPNVRLFDDAGQDRLLFNSVAKALVSGTPASLFSITLADGAMVGGSMEYMLRFQNATDQQVMQGFTTFSAVRKGATTTVAHTYVAANEAKAVSAGTLTLTATAADGGSGLATFSITATSSLSSVTLADIYYSFWPQRGVWTIL